MEKKVDILVIGSGPSGQKASIQGSKFGRSVTIVESWELGGSSLWTATIPSKALREAICDLTDFRTKSFYANHATLPSSTQISITDLNHRVSWVKGYLKNQITQHLIKNDIEIARGVGRFVDDHTIEVDCGDHKDTYVASKIIIATGSKPSTPEGIKFDGEKIFNSTQLLSLSFIPNSMLVIGAGIIGVEYASMFCLLGCRVTLVDKRERMLSMLDREITNHLRNILEGSNLRFLPNKVYENINTDGDGVSVKFSDGTQEVSDIVLIAAGREANVDYLCLEKASLSLGDNGYISVNENCQSEVDHIYGVGDVIGGVSLASVAQLEGRKAAIHACGFSNKEFTKIFPYGIYTIPEISYVGKNEEELKRLDVEYEVGRAYFYELSKSVISGSDVGMCKIIFDPFKLTIYGVHIIGEGAADLIHIGQLAISFNAKISYFVEELFNYPTFSEMYRIAALNGLNKIKKV